MNIATLRVEGTESALEKTKQTLQVVCDTEWKKGENKRNGNTYNSSGFSVTIADASSPGELTDQILAFLDKCKNSAIAFSAPELKAELDIGVTVGESQQFVASVEFSPPDLMLCAECGITLSITAYPTSDEANDDGDAP